MAGVRSAERDATESLFRALRLVPATEPVAEEAGLLAQGYWRSHGSTDVVDHVVAANAQVHDAEVWTLNVKDFPVVERLRPPY